MRRMPAEWEKQDAVWLAWPHHKHDWPDRFAPIPWVYGEIVRHIARHQTVRIVVKSEKMREEVRILLERLATPMENIDFVPAATDRVWLRDSGGILVHEGSKRVLLDWHFNAWAKYDNWRRDDQIPSVMAQRLNIAPLQPMRDGQRIVLEGGAIETNGAGVLLVTEECLLSEQQCRNPGFTRADYESVFLEYLGIQRTIWLERGIAGDDTHGHIDDCARFVNETTIVTLLPEDRNDADYGPMRENLRRLEAARDANGHPFTVIPLPAPRPLIFEGERLPASYANFLITNGTVLVPVFNDPNDRVALDILSKLFPEREVRGIYCGDFIWGLGTIHCATQQEPA
jgi:agmatine deiminase